MGTIYVSVWIEPWWVSLSRWQRIMLLGQVSPLFHYRYKPRVSQLAVPSPSANPRR